MVYRGQGFTTCKRGLFFTLILPLLLLPLAIVSNTPLYAGNIAPWGVEHTSDLVSLSYAWEDISRDMQSVVGPNVTFYSNTTDGRLLIVDTVPPSYDTETALNALVLFASRMVTPGNTLASTPNLQVSTSGTGGDFELRPLALRYSYPDGGRTSLQLNSTNSSLLRSLSLDLTMNVTQDVTDIKCTPSSNCTPCLSRCVVLLFTDSEGVQEQQVSFSFDRIVQVFDDGAIGDPLLVSFMPVAGTDGFLLTVHDVAHLSYELASEVWTVPPGEPVVLTSPYILEIGSLRTDTRISRQVEGAL